MLSPNLHVACCQLPRQEASRGAVASELEWFMERFMHDPQRGMKALHAEKNYLNSTELPRRGLLHARAHHGCATSAELKAAVTGNRVFTDCRDPSFIADQVPCFKGKGVRVVSTSAVQKRRCHPDSSKLDAIVRKFIATAAAAAAAAASGAASAVAQGAGNLAAALASVVQAAQGVGLMADADVCADLQETTVAAQVTLEQLAEEAAHADTDARAVRSQLVADFNTRAAGDDAAPAGPDQACVELGNAATALRALGTQLLDRCLALVSEAQQHVVNVDRQLAILRENPYIAIDALVAASSAAAVLQAATTQLRAAACEAGWFRLDLSSTTLWDSLQLTRFTQCKLPSFVTCSAVDVAVDYSKGGVSSWAVMQRGAGEEAVELLVHVKAFLLIERKMDECITGDQSSVGCSSEAAPGPIRLAFCHECGDCRTIDVEGTASFLASRQSIGAAWDDAHALFAVAVHKLIAPVAICDAPYNDPPAVLFLPVKCKPLAHNNDFI